MDWTDAVEWVGDLGDAFVRGLIFIATLFVGTGKLAVRLWRGRKPKWPGTLTSSSDAVTPVTFVGGMTAGTIAPAAEADRVRLEAPKGTHFKFEVTGADAGA